MATDSTVPMTPAICSRRSRPTPPRLSCSVRAWACAKRAVPWSSRFGRGFSGFWVRASGGPSLSDSQTGFRVYPLPETLLLPTRARRFQFEVEVLVHAHRAGIPIREVPVGVAYDPPGGRVSHFRPWRDFARNAATFTRLIASRFLPRRSLRGHSPGQDARHGT